MNIKKNTRYFWLAAIDFAPVFSIMLLIALFANNMIYAQESHPAVNNAAYSTGVAGSFTTEQKQDGDLCSINAIRRYIARNIIYPESAIVAGHAGTIELYARISNEGNVNEVLELQPHSDYVVVDDIIIVENAPEGVKITNSTRHSGLIAESRRVVMSLPKCDIQEIFGQTLKFTLKFVLQQ